MIWNTPNPVTVGKGKKQKEWDPTKKISQAKGEREPRELMDSKGFDESVQWNNGRLED